ncbi:M20/M25/M40 family metallo-hydrolase [Nocardioides sp.]|uniref:M20/M25/M40 family metallo-hydrolase n=1 Tax=Nocardioides sp. TaxID=35761 RepID=UPI0035281794
MSPGTDLHEEVLRVARDLIRIDTTNGNETEAAAYLRDYLAAAGVEAEVVARDPARGNLVARLPGTGEAPSLAFVGHLDVVPADPQDWTHPPFEAVVEDGWLFGRGAVDMKDEVAARCVAFAELARSGFRPRGDLWLVMVADEEDGAADVGMRWLLEHRPDLRPDLAVNEGGGQRLELADGRVLLMLSVGEKGTQPVRLTALGEAGHASMPTLGDNAVVRLGELLRRIGPGLATPGRSPLLDATHEVLLEEPATSVEDGLRRATPLHPTFADGLPPLAGTTMAPTLLAGSTARNVMPARASVELDCRILPGVEADDVLAAVRTRLGDDLTEGVDYELSLPEPLVPGSASAPDGALPAAIAAWLAETDPGTGVLPVLCTGYTDSSFLRAAGDTAAYGFSPFRATPTEVLDEGVHNADERIHVDDLLLSVEFHLDLARRLLG